MTESAMLHVRVDGDVKARASEAFAAMGLSMSEAIRVFLKRVAADQAMPFVIGAPNPETRAAMEESRRVSSGRFETADALFHMLDENAK